MFLFVFGQKIKSTHKLSNTPVGVHIEVPSRTYQAGTAVYPRPGPSIKRLFIFRILFINIINIIKRDVGTKKYE